MPRTSFDEFARLAADYNMVPLVQTLLADGLTPPAAALKLAGGEWSFLFESVVGGERVGRYSFLSQDPFLTFVAHGRRVTVATGGRTETTDCADPLAKLDEILAGYRTPHLPGLPRFVGGAVGYAAYDSVRYAENLPDAPEDDRGLPDVCFGLYDRMVVFDHIRKVVMVVSLAAVDADDLPGSFAAADARLDELIAALSAPVPPPLPEPIDLSDELTLAYTSDFTRQRFEAAVETCKEYIRAGDFFQIVPSQRFETATDVDPFEVYRTLRVVNPSPFMVHLHLPACTLVASSPEIMVRVDDRLITTRPLAGTRPRGATEAEDRRLAAELLADPKECAEHVMLVDLGRNDVGRVAQVNTVELADLMTVERYSHVMHITSNVQGVLRDDLTPLDALKACLPAGTVSGAPKVRAMEVIDEIEPHRRGPYGGAIGYIDFTGNMDTCIALRTIVFCGGKAYVQAGAGIVLDSDPAAEYRETCNKARAMVTAIELTLKRTGLPRSQP